MSIGQTRELPCGCREAVGRQYGTDLFATTSVRLRQHQIRRPADRVRAAALPALIGGGGRGGSDVRVSLWLWSVFFAHVASERHQEPIVDLGRREWAMRLHLLDPRSRNHPLYAERAARRVDSAIRRLEADRLLERVHGTATWRVLRADRSGRPYQSETDEDLELRMESRQRWMQSADHGQHSLRYQAIGYGPSGPHVWAEFWEERPLEVPVSLWANGWVSGLSGSALLAFLILIDQAGPRRDNTQPIRVPRIRRSQYAVTKEVWLKGRNELEFRGVIKRKVGSLSGAVNRELYFLNLETLESQNLCSRRVEQRHGPGHSDTQADGRAWLQDGGVRKRPARF